jgi:hypothetical protein
MKRMIPLLIAASAGYVLIASRFIPLAEKWGEVEAIWFDILAAIAFILGGGSLLKLHLRRISDRAAGWGYSAVTLIAFGATLYVGIAKTGAQPAAQQEFYGQSFAPLTVAELPESMTYRVPGSIPKRADDEPLPQSVQRQLSEADGDVVFRGWMSGQQQSELSDFKEELSWRCSVEKLSDEAKPPGALKGKASYRADYSRLGFSGYMTDEDHAALLKLGSNVPFVAAVDELWKASHEKSLVSVEQLPAGFAIPASKREFLFYDEKTHELAILGPMSAPLRDELARDHFPVARPTTPEQRTAFLHELESHGSQLSEAQATALDSVLSKTWSLDGLRFALNAAGHPVPAEKSACELYAEQTRARPSAAPRPPAAAANAGPQNPAPQKPEADVQLNAAQQAALEEFVRQPGETVDELAARLRAAGPFSAQQNSALEEFFSKVPTAGEQKLNACIEVLRIGPLTREQRDFLRHDYREQFRWRETVGQLFLKAHKVKYPWSGQYNSPGSFFGWMYEFMFKPLTATMFSLLAFYVASAAFRAFRAKNFEALLLLGTAFIILLAQTFAGYWLTSWLPADTQTSAWAWLRIENMKILIMGVFTTAGTRAIMIGIALGIASVSVKIMLGQDRSYVGRD